MSSKRKIRRKSCDNKTRYDDKESAAKVLQFMFRKHDYIGKIYKCKFCKGYHIGRPPKNITKVKTWWLYC